MNKLEIKAVKFQNYLGRVFPSGKINFFGSAIITAAGSGTRMGGVSKQLMPICGKPCLLYSLIAFQSCPEINEIIVVAKDSEKELIEKICIDNHITKLVAIATGGATRQESVKNGFSLCHKKSDFVAIHDGARPLIRPCDVTLLVNMARKHGASCAAKKVVDTVKRADGDAVILSTVPRDDLYTVQTPQVFKTDLYRVSLALAEKDKIEVTDDCSLAENAGFKIKLCDLGIYNLKLTHPEDVSVIEKLLKGINND